MDEKVRVLLTWHAAVETAYRRIVRELRNRGAEVRLIVPVRWTEGGRSITVMEEDLDDRDAIVLRTIFTDRIRAFFYPNLLKIAQEMRTFSPHILHIMEEPFSLCAHEFLRLATFVGSRARRVLYSFENIDVPQRPPFSSIQRFNLRNADAIVVVPEEGGELWRRRGFKGRIYTIPLGIDTDLFRRVDVRDRAHGDTGGFRLGFVGRIVEEKGLDTVIRALAILKKRGKRVHLHVAGSGKEDYIKEILRTANDTGTGGMISFVGPLTQDELPRFYSEMDTLVLPSRTTPTWKEQFGRVLVEAMACGVAVVGSSSGEIPNVVGEAGLVFKEGDGDDLAFCIERLIDDPALREELGKRGRKRVMDRYSWGAVADKYIRMYEELLKG